MAYRNPGPAKQGVPWGLADMVLAGLATVVLMVVGLFVLVTAALFAGLELQNPENQALLGFAMLGLEALMIPPVWWWGVHKHGAKAAILGLRRAPWLRSAVYIGLGLAAILAMNVGWAWVMERYGLQGQPDIVPLFGEGPSGLAIALLVAGIVAPVAEELFFRGFLFAGLRDRWGLPIGIALSSALFSVVHFVPGVMLPIAFMGALFAWLYQATDSLWPPILLHALYNGLAVIGMYAAQGL